MEHIDIWAFVSQEDRQGALPLRFFRELMWDEALKVLSLDTYTQLLAELPGAAHYGGTPVMLGVLIKDIKADRLFMIVLENVYDFSYMKTHYLKDHVTQLLGFYAVPMHELRNFHTMEGPIPFGRLP